MVFGSLVLLYLILNLNIAMRLHCNVYMVPILGDEFDGWTFIYAWRNIVTPKRVGINQQAHVQNSILGDGPGIYDV